MWGNVKEIQRQFALDGTSLEQLKSLAPLFLLRRLFILCGMWWGLLCVFFVALGGLLMDAEGSGVAGNGDDESLLWKSEYIAMYSSHFSERWRFRSIGQLRSPYHYLSSYRQVVHVQRTRACLSGKAGFGESISSLFQVEDSWKVGPGQVSSIRILLI